MHCDWPVNEFKYNYTWPRKSAALLLSWPAGSSIPQSAPGAQQFGLAGLSSQHPACVLPSPALDAFSLPSSDALQEYKHLVANGVANAWHRVWCLLGFIL